MKKTSVLSVCMMTLTVLFIITATDVSADDVGPEITDVFQVPNYPLYGENVTVYATITDFDGINQVELGYCDEFLCYANVPMTPLGNDVYSATILWNNDWGNGSIIGYDFWVTDNGMNITHTEYIYYFIVSEIDMDIEAEDTIFLGDVLILNGSARYDGNETAYVINSNVTVRITETGQEYYTTTDMDGNFSLELPFNIPGDFTINTTVSNRTLVAYDELSVTVIGITYLSQDVQMTTCYPGQNIWVNGTARYSTEEPVANSDVLVKINETLFWSGKTDSQGNYSILIIAPGEVNQYAVNVTVTNGSLSASAEAAISVTEIPLPDLYVESEDIVFSSASDPPISHESVNISVSVQNLGSANCTDVAVNFYFGHPSEGDLMGSDTIPSISMGETGTASILWVAQNATHEIWVVADPFNTTSESIEDNNNASSSLFVDEDTDGDGVGNLVDLDDDGDGANDDEDAFPRDPAASVDTDEDGKPNDWNTGKTSTDSTTGLTLDSDDDDDGVNDTEDAFPLDSSEWLDTDGDGKGNNVDTDDDDDGLTDVVERALETDPINPDTDGDGVDDMEDYDPLDPKVKTEPSSSFQWILIIIVIVIVVVLLMVVFMFINKKKK